MSLLITKTPKWCSLLLFLFAAFGAVWAQNTATISGVVTDSSGAVLPGAAVQITNEDTGITRTVVSDEQGRYHARELTLGRYRVEGSLQGFQKMVRTGIVL